MSIRAISRKLQTISNLMRNPSLPLLYFAARANMPRICAYIAMVSMKCVRPKHSSGSAQYRFLILNKSVFIEDVYAISKEFDNAELILFGRTQLHFIAKAFFPDGTNDNNYHDVSGEKVIKKYRKFLFSMIPVILKRTKVSCALSGNFSYFEERELAYVLDALGIPFVVVHKECLKTEARIEEYEGLYRGNKGPFWGTQILVYNTIERDLIVRTGVTAQENVSIIGMPRLDALHKSRLASEVSGCGQGVLLISFHKDLNTLENFPGVEMPSLDRIWDSVHLSMFRLAEQYPDLPVTIKTKGSVKDLEWIEDLVRRNDLREGLPNLKIVHGGKIQNLIVDAKVIVGVHSTALLEALAANKPVIVPEYEELADSNTGRHLVDFGNTVIRVGSENELDELLLRELTSSADRTRLPKATADLLDAWLGNSDGQASVRAANEIRKLIDA